MSFKGAKFGFGPKELGGSVDLISHFRLRSHHEFFCKRPLPMSVSETHYLKNVMGEREIRKGDGMELDQLSKNLTLREKKQGRVHPFGLDVLADAFHMRETATPILSTPDRGTSIAVTKLESKSKDSHHEKNKSKRTHKNKTKGTKDRTHQRLDGNEMKDKKRDGLLINCQDPMKHRDKKRKHDGNEYPPSAQRRQLMSVSKFQ